MMFQSRNYKLRHKIKTNKTQNLQQKACRLLESGTKYYLGLGYILKHEEYFITL